MLICKYINNNAVLEEYGNMYIKMVIVFPPYDALSQIST